LTDIRADELLSDIARQLVNMATGPGRRLTIQQDFEPVRLTPDQAVPLSLFLTEALTNAMKYADRDDEELPYLTLTLTRVGETRVILRIANSIGATPRAKAELPGDLSEPTGLGTQLLEAFSQQIGGDLQREEGAGYFALSLEFTLAALTDAEARNAPRDSQDMPPAENDD